MFTQESMVSFTALDRCDRCGAQAAACADKIEGKPLFFCGHCSNKFKNALLSTGWTIRWDESQEYYNY